MPKRCSTRLRTRTREPIAAPPAFRGPCSRRSSRRGSATCCATCCAAVRLGIPSALKVEELRCALLDARPGAQTPHSLARRRRPRFPSASLFDARAAVRLAGRLPRPPRQGRRLVGPRRRLRFEPAATGDGLPESWLDAGLELRFRGGGEDFRPLDRPHSHPLKRWFHDAAIVPWMRSRIPLLYRGDRLVAVADLWLGHDVLSVSSLEPRWRVQLDSPPPHPLTRLAPTGPAQRCAPELGWVRVRSFLPRSSSRASGPKDALMSLQMATTLTNG